MKRNPEDPKTGAPVTFGPPVVAAGVTDPQALRYAQSLQERRGVPGPARYTAPVGGGPGPAIPRLDAPADSGLTMADQANMHRAATEGPPRASVSLTPQSSMFQGAGPSGGALPPIPRPSTPAAGPGGLLAIDILPDVARQDPDFREGQGSMYATAQPALAYKYGVIRNGKPLAPQQLGAVNAGLSQKTIEGLKAVQEAQTFRGQQVESEDARATREAAAGVAGHAGRLGNAPTEGPETSAGSAPNIQEAVKKLDDFDFNSFRESMMKDIINNEDQREIIESRLQPLDLTDMITRGFVTQRVPIIPNKFEPEFQSMTGTEDLAIKRLVMQESKGVEVSDRYLLDKFSLMAVTIGLRAINGNPMPTHTDQKGDFDEEKFWSKFAHVTKYPFHMLGSLGVNYFWFDIRVRKLFVAEKLGNG